MSITLYRKYRPQVFEDLIDQDIVKETLQNEIKSGAIAHAYLFSGPRGLGKTTTARLLAKAINCQQRKDKDFEPCNVCDSCQAIIGNRSLDLIEIDAASNRGINEIRQLKEHIGFTPSGSNYRVFIIDEVHMLTAEAFNALLKTLEEPPQHAIFILATTELHKVPDTIISRCQTFTFRRVDEQHLAERLAMIADKEGIKVDEKVLKHIAHLSGGFIRDAESMLGQLLSLGEKKVTQDIAKLVLPTSNVDFVVSFLAFLHAAKTSDALSHVNNLADQGVDLEYFSKELLEALRQLLISRYSTVEFIDEHLLGLQGKFGVNQLLKLIGLVDNALKEIKRADIPQLPLELVVVDYIENYNSPNSQKAKADDTEEDKEEDDSNRPDARHETPQGSSSKNHKSSKLHKVKLKDIEKQWPEVIKLAKQYNHSLPMLLNVGHLLSFGEVAENTLEIGFEYELHVTRLNDAKVQTQLQTIITEVMGAVFGIQARLLSAEEKDKIRKPLSEEEEAKEQQLVNDVLEAFGGQLVGD